MKLTSLLLAAALTAAPAYAGGPVIVEDDSDIIAPRDTAEWVLPVVIGAVILCAIACGGGDDDAPQEIKPPGPVCKEGC